MFHKSAVIEIRQRLGVPEEGFALEDEALAWYKDHYYRAKSEDYKGTFGFQYDSRGYVDFEYEIGQNFLKIYSPHPLDDAVPLDREALILAKESNIPNWAVPCFRLVILLGEPPEDIELHIPDHLIAPLGNFRVLVHPAKQLSLRKWRETGAMMELLPRDIDLWKVPGTITTYSPKRANKMEFRYRETFLAYGNAIGERRMRGQRGKRGLLVETAKILEAHYGWEYEPDSYTVRRYLDRANKIWHISTW